ncbi:MULTISPECIES: MarR family winged helix-turn-helix transcriptional regulator [unclassified Streptomyces]|uniref:MarR family winged helix-turn-helix transcriptional regulator n=1 Tax=unclassified Streptomyces TaxID=2593676 RepID=UPI002E2A54E3|nr:MarR family winged helix-turn-helix transcriptional regulator [Streptomyces sp. NBC_01439]
MYDRGSGSSSPSEQTVHLLAAAGRAADALMTERVSAGGPSPLHRSVLRTLAELGPHARRDLAEQMGVPPVDVTRAIRDLLAQGLVQDMVVNIGGRHEVVTLTPTGATALTTVQDDMNAVQDVLLASLTKGERTQLHYLLRRVCATAARAGAVRSAST